MKIRIVFVLIFICACLTGCFDKVDPLIRTLYLKEDDMETQRSQAVSRLYEHYVTSRFKDGQGYEVISKKHGRFILHFAPILGLLTVCGDPGSGWARQYEDVDELILKKLVDENITFNDLYGTGPMSYKVDSMLVKKNPIYNVNTNGSPI
ncbi:hypothetical protein [Dyadobacter sp. CY323]|uniref:hypothetical protein n=1 Tax=Dyadobacter sp. CY323 TaxID=2907302 RepID=UPI001F254401|nr:hypothetical protein [Dyadobacter sp. CY323]MCE6992368.1 hypothetical protein [Dyadobacter sp. CY323]